MSKVRVLVIDDANFIRDLVKKALRDHLPGVQIEEAINGRKAQQLLNRQPVELILCDWEMPEMSGLELLTWCRGQDSLKTTPFIMVTSRGDKENVVQAIQAGVADFIGKPFSNEQLITKVKKALHRSGVLQNLEPRTPPKMLSSGSFANDSLSALTAGKTESAAPPSAAPTQAREFVAPPVPKKTAAGYGQGQLRLADSSTACVIKALSLKEALLVVKRTESLPQVLASAVLDLEQGDNAEVARLNGYLHAIAAFEPKPDSEWLQLTLRFVDSDAQKLDYLSRMIARGSPQKHFIPGA